MQTKLVVDANELFAAIITKGRDMQNWALDILFSDKVKFFAPFKLLAELEKNRELIKSKSGFSERDFDAFVEIIKMRVEFVPLEMFLDKISEAKKLSPHLKDVEYFALALKFNCSVWSEEKAFREQTKIKAFDSKELAEKLGLLNSS